MARAPRLLAALGLVLLTGLAGCGEDDDGAVRVGVILPMSGDQATYGEESWRGLQLAQDDLKAAGVKVPFRLLLQDEKSNPREAETQAKTLTEVNGVHVLLGTVASSNTAKIGGVAKAAGIPCITPASTNDDLTKDNPFLSRICYKDSVQGRVLAEFARGSGWTRAVVVVDNESDYSRGFAANFQTSFEADGGTTHFEYFKSGNADFSNVIQSVADAKPEVIFFSGYYSDGGTMIKQAKARWAGLPIIGGDGLDSAVFFSLLGDATNPIYFTTHFAPDAPDERIQSFTRRYTERFGEQPGAMSALGYDVLFVLVDALKRCKDPKDPDALAAAIAATHGVVGISGEISLDNPERTPVKDVIIVKVVGGAKSYHATIKP
jgi:branched-chain amino acid transport system substrate-binding protein